MNVNRAQKRTKTEKSVETRAMFIRIARELFAKQGFANTSTQQILANTPVTRGALYHQFADKADLLRAVCEQIQAEIAQEISTASEQAQDSFEALLIGCDVYLDAVARLDVQRILIIDAPAVLGWDSWYEIDQPSFQLLVEGMEAAIADGFLTVQSAEALAVLLNGAITDGVCWAARSSNPTEKLAEVRTTAHQLMHGLRSVQSVPPMSS
jgi:AcrR family transcriptional regulator